MGWLRRIALLLLGRFGARLRYPHLFMVAGVCFVLDVLLPDGLPFLDELLLGLSTLFFALWRKRGSGGVGEDRGTLGSSGMRDVTPPGGDRR